MKTSSIFTGPTILAGTGECREAGGGGIVVTETRPGSGILARGGEGAAVGERIVYRNLWYGLTLEHPAGWQVRQVPGCVVVSPDAGLVTCAAVRFFAVDPGLPLRQVAEQVVGLLRQAEPGVRAWTEPEQPGAGITVHVSVTVSGTPVRGRILLQARDGSVLATSLQAPDGELAARAPVLGEILASLRFEDPPRLLRFDDTAEHAFGGYAPQDWAVQASLRRTPTPERIPVPVLSATDPVGEMSLQVPPSYEQYSERPVLGGRLPFIPYPGVAAYLRRIAAGPLSRERPGVRAGDVVPEPVFAALERAQSAPGIPSQVESASIVLTYDQGGVPYREAVTATLVRLVTLGSWTARIAARRRAPAGRYGEADTMFCGILQSITPDPGWVRAEQARAGQVLGQAMGRNAQAQNDLVNAVRHLGQVRRDGAAGLADGAMRHMNNFFREQELHVLPALRGDQIMINPVDGRRYEVPLTYGTYWSDPAQYVYRTTSPGDPPVVGATRLEPI